MKKWLIAIITIMMGFTLISCVNTEEYDVYTTVYPMKFVTEQIFQGTGYTVGIVPGVTSHENSVDWSPKEIIAMTNATYLFYVGANYDQYIDFQIESIFNDSNVELVRVEDETNYIQFIEGVVHSHDETTEETTIEETTLGFDPHFWVSPLKVQQVSALIYNKLKLKFDDPNGLMETNYDNLVAALQDLSDAFSEVIENASTEAMTSTNIYGYLRSDYGFEYFSISPGYHEETEQFTTQEKNEIVTHALDEGIQYIIYEKNISSPLSDAVFAELDVSKLEFNILQTLTDEEIQNGNDYISVMYDNLELLKLAVGYIETE
ncbi:MAG: zinc ABC transporter substrate-binding protein [Bacilli bacterium]|nr:zinc ABC transporter substrate-binding protein [Bacilli bacterium]